MAYAFEINREALKREFAVYVVIAKKSDSYQLYVGKTGDNREGCNPLISRCGNHFSYNKIHSQIRNKIKNHERCEYTYVFDHFGEYSRNDQNKRDKINEINELERWLNIEIQKLCKITMHCILVNPYMGKSYVNKNERVYRKSFHTARNIEKISNIVTMVRNKLEF